MNEEQAEELQERVDILEDASDMRFNQYQERALSTALPQAHGFDPGIVYCTLGLNGEAGEVAEKVKKWIRGDLTDLNIEAVAYELGDVLWYLSVLAANIGYSLSEIAQMNVDKLASRRERDLLKGSGDDR